jgi:drug/metabolite transporter (DMT)-like permease
MTAEHTRSLAPIGIALLSAALFGAATPASKLLLDGFTPLQLAGLLYMGAALGVVPMTLRSGGLRLPGTRDRRNRLRLFGAVLAGGVAGPVLLLLALQRADASSVALWLNFELAATALLGAIWFREHFGAFGWSAVGIAFVGAGVLSVPNGMAGIGAACLVLAACTCWGLDNHLTALIDGITPSQSTFWKGLVAGTVNIVIGFGIDPRLPDALLLFVALVVGVFAYGVSIVLYIFSAQSLGATRAQVAFASAPFFGVLFAVLLVGEPLTFAHIAAGTLFLAAVALFTLERHDHTHTHKALEHEHSHRHDDGHHQHRHPGLAPATRHTHRHRHEPLVHRHPHWPDLHHRHDHLARSEEVASAPTTPEST